MLFWTVGRKYRNLIGNKTLILYIHLIKKSEEKSLQAIEGAEPEDLIGRVHGKREDAVQRLF